MQGLLAYLAVEADRPHRREALAGLFWGEQSPEAAHNSLRQALFRLHRTFQDSSPAVLLVTAQSVQFNAACDHALDVAQFTHWVASCERHIHRRIETCPRCAEFMERATGLYRGEFLAGLYLKDSVEFEEWVLNTRERLSQMALHALNILAEYHARGGEYEEMAQAARRQIEIDPFREQAHRQFLLAQAWGGRRTAALAHYAALERMLRHELGAPPEQETRHLHRQIQSETLARPKPPGLIHAPVQVTAFLSREKELGWIGEQLQNPAIRLVTLTGPGGIGKTRLALEAGARAALAFENGAYFVSLADLGSPDFLLPAIASTVDLTFSRGVDLQLQLVRWLRDKDLLLLLDSFEHVMEAAPLVADLLRTCSRLTILVTSRERLHLRGEQILQVPPLALPGEPVSPAREQDWIASLAQNPAVALFLDRARATENDLALSPANARVIAEICSRLEGIPLALELAASRISALSPRELLERLSSRLALLTGGYRDLPARQRTLQATLDWSYALLDREDQDLFGRLGVFAGGCTLESAAEVIPIPQLDRSGPALSGARHAPPEDGFRSLVDKSLLLRQDYGGEIRLKMLDTIREYAVQCLEASGGAEEIRQRHARYFLRLAETADAELKGSQQAAWLARLVREQANLRAALHGMIDRGEAEPALRLAGALARFWRLRGHLAEGLEGLGAALALAARSGDGQDDDLHRLQSARAAALLGVGWLLRDRGDMREMVRYFEAGLELYEKLEDRAGTAYALYSVASGTFSVGQHERGARLWQESLAIYRELGDAWGIGMCLMMLARLAMARGDYAPGQDLLTESIALQRNRGDAYRTAVMLGHLGELCMYWGDDARAFRALDESQALLEPVGEREMRTWVRLMYGQLEWRLGRLDDARRTLESVLEEARAVGYRWHTAYALRYLGAVASAAGDAPAAERLCRESLALFREVGSEEDIAQSTKTLARVLLYCGRAEEARMAYREALPVYLSRGYRPAIADALEGLGCAQVELGESESAAKLFGAADRLRQTTGDALPPVLQPFYQARVEEARTRLGQEAFQAAWTEGHAMSLEQAGAYGPA